MENRCPKCNTKLSVFYLNPECHNCGCNIMNYNMDERLEADAEKAEAEWAKADAFLAKFKRKKGGKKSEND